MKNIEKYLYLQKYPISYFSKMYRNHFEDIIHALKELNQNPINTDNLIKFNKVHLPPVREGSNTF